MRCTWWAVYRSIATELAELPAGQQRTYTLDELFSRSGGDQEPRDFGRRSYWASAMQGDSYWSGVGFSLIVVSFTPDEHGVPVERVTIRLRRERRK